MKITVVTPSFNQSEFIRDTIQSVLTQRPNQHTLEYIVIDGNSTDHTVSILKEFDHALIWQSEPDHGQSHALNKGLRLATGDIIGWLNSDDIYCPDTLNKVAAFFLDHPEVDIVYGGAHLIDRTGQVTGTYLTERFCLERLKARCFISQPAVFFRRSVIEKHGFINESLHFCMDYEYWLRLGQNGARFAYLPEILACARIYPQTKSSRYCLEASHEIMALLQQTLGYIPPEWLVSYSGARVKQTSKLSYPNPRFIFAVWLNLWKVTGQQKKGYAHLIAWLDTQRAMLKEFLIRAYLQLRCH